MDNLEKIYDFIRIVGNLKNTYRWCKTRDGREESTAEHTWRLVMMAILLQKELKLDIDLLRALKIAVVHDIPESITGDMDAALLHLNGGQDLKTQNEIKAMTELKDKLPERIGKEIFDLWQEYEKHETQESKFIKALDKIETHTGVIETGHEYFEEWHLDFTVHYCDRCVTDFPQLIPYYKILKQRLKEEYLAGGFEWKDEYDVIHEG